MMVMMRVAAMVVLLADDLNHIRAVGNPGSVPNDPNGSCFARQ